METQTELTGDHRGSGSHASRLCGGHGKVSWRALWPPGLSSDQLILQRATRNSARREGEGPVCPQWSKGMFYEWLLFRPQSLWVKFILVRKTPGAIFLNKGSDFIVPYVRERKRGSEQCFLLTTVADSVQLWLLRMEGQSSVTLVISTNRNHSISATLWTEPTPRLCSQASSPWVSLKQTQMLLHTLVASELASLSLARPV